MVIIFGEAEISRKKEEFWAMLELIYFLIFILVTYCVHFVKICFTKKKPFSICVLHFNKTFTVQQN